MGRKAVVWTLIVVVNVVVISVLSLHSSTAAAPPSARSPFANSVEQRGQMIKELQEIKALMSEQNRLLRAIAKQETPDEQNQR